MTSWKSLGDSAALLPSEGQAKRMRNIAYLMKLKEDNLLFPYWWQAGLTGSINAKLEGLHGGWDSQTSHIRGTFTAHWISAAAYTIREQEDRRLRAKLEGLMAAGKISERSRVLFVNDGSRDRTWELITRLHGGCPLFCGADLSRNRGHQNALLAGLMTAKERCDMAISMDADLQDDIDAVDAMVEQYYAGCDVVYGVRSSRKKDTFFKRFTAEGFYRVMNFMGAETVFNHADYRLMSRRALEGLAQFREVNLFLRGIVPMIGYRTGTVEYERGERFAGESKYPLKKMLSFAMEGITSLSVKPIRYITGLGFLIFAVSILMLIYSIVRWATGATIIGWASVICSVWAIGGLILLSLGVIGEYIGKIYLETKARPRFLIREILEDGNGKAD